MWQINWILSLVSEAVWTSLLIGSLIALAGTYVLKFIKPFAIYGSIIRPVAIIIAFFAVYWQGGFDNEKKWQAKVKEMESKVAVAEAESKDANTELVKVKKKKSKVRKEYITTVKERIVEKEKLIDAECKIDPSVPQILNDAARNIAKKGTVTIGPIEEVKK